MQKNFKKRILSVLAVLLCLHMILNAAYLKNNNYLRIEVREGVKVSELEQAAVYAILSNLPPVLVQNYTMDGNMIYITDSRFHPDYKKDAREGTAYIYYDENETYIEVVKSRYLEEMVCSFYHEFGHYLDNIEDCSWHLPITKNYRKFINSCKEKNELFVWKVSEKVWITNNDHQEYYANQFANMMMIRTGTINEDDFTCKEAQFFIKANLLWLNIKTWLRPNYLGL